MIILITGSSGSGKSTIIEKLVELYDGSKQWVITREIRNDDGDRVGFKAINDARETEVISHKYDIESDTVVGRNKVNVDAVNKMFTIDKSVGDRLIFIDEIGPIQFLSRDFTKSLKRLFRSGSTQLVATIHYTDKPFARYRSAKNATLVHVSDANRDSLPSALMTVIMKRTEIDALSSREFKAFKRLLVEYLETQQEIQLSKLLNHALPYVNGSKVKRLGIGKLLVDGKHGQHIVHRTRRTYTCDCDLFVGRGMYAHKAGVCSHVQAVLIKHSVL